jgi:hypothetical protein
MSIATSICLMAVQRLDLVCTVTESFERNGYSLSAPAARLRLTGDRVIARAIQDGR